jgi:hypothetical protein
MSKVHVIKDENLGGVLREFVEVDRKAEVGEYIFTINTKEIHKVTKVSEDGVYIDGWVYVYDEYYRTLEPVHECDQCRKALGELACTNSKCGSYCSANCANADEETSPTVHEMLANLSEQIVKLNRRIDRLADTNEQAITTVARDVERVDADLIKLRKEFEDSKDVTLSLSSELVAKLIEKGLNG